MDSASLANQISQYDKTPVNSVDALNSAMAQYGVPEMRQRVAGLNTTIMNTQNALNSVDPSVTGRTQGSLVTEAQREKQVNNERAPIAQQLSDQNGALGTASSGLSDAEKNAQLLATNQVNDYNTGRQALVDEYNIANSRETAAAQAAAAQAAAAQAQANTDRSFRLQQQAASGYSLGSTPAPTTVSTPMKIAQMAKTNQGFRFTDANGQPISAAEYSQLRGIGFRDLLQQMANAGDQGSRIALDYVGNDYGYNAAKLGSNGNIANILNSLLSGVNNVKTTAAKQTPKLAVSPAQNMQANAAKGLGILKK